MSKIKLCGLRRKEDIDFVNESMPDYVGFVFAKSRRQITMEQAVCFHRKLNDRILAVGVFVNESANRIVDYVKAGAIDMIQLHGDETEEYVKELKQLTDVPVIQAVRVRNADEIIQADQSSADYLLLDAFTPCAYGGTGEKFAWGIIPDNIRHPFFLAGGIRVDNIQDALKKDAYCIDVSGGVETDGKKDKVKIAQIVELVRNTKGE